MKPSLLLLTAARFLSTLNLHLSTPSSISTTPPNTTSPTYPSASPSIASFASAASPAPANPRSSTASSTKVSSLNSTNSPKIPPRSNRSPSLIPPALGSQLSALGFSAKSSSSINPRSPAPRAPILHSIPKRGNSSATSTPRRPPPKPPVSTPRPFPLTPAKVAATIARDSATNVWRCNSSPTSSSRAPSAKAAASNPRSSRSAGMIALSPTSSPPASPTPFLSSPSSPKSIAASRRSIPSASATSPSANLSTPSAAANPNASNSSATSAPSPLRPHQKSKVENRKSKIPPAPCFCSTNPPPVSTATTSNVSFPSSKPWSIAAIASS